MHIEKLHKSKFMSPRNTRGVATISFYHKGEIHLSRNAVRQLGLYDIINNKLSSVSVFVDKDEHTEADFFVMRDDTDGWCLRRAYGGGAVFNSCELARHVIRKTWESNRHLASEDMPRKMIFRVASLPVDDDKNKNVFALLRKIT